MTIKSRLREYERAAAKSIRGDVQQLTIPNATKIRAGIVGGLPSDSLLMDPISGCLSAKAACYGTCFAAAAAFEEGIDFGKRVENELDESVLRADLSQIPNQQGHMRCGWNSDPSWNWELSARVAEIVAEYDKNVIFLTKAFTAIPADVAQRLVDVKAELWVGMAAQSEDKNIQRRFNAIEAYRDLGGTAVVPLLTSAYALMHLSEKQDMLAAMIIDRGFVGAENSMRVSITDPIVQMGILDQQKLFAIEEEETPLYWSGRFYDESLLAPTVTSLKDSYNGGIPSHVTEANYSKSTMSKLFADVIPTHEQLSAGEFASRPRKSGLSRSWTSPA